MNMGSMEREVLQNRALENKTFQTRSKKQAGEKRILVVHGWMHSAARYRRLKRDLESSGLFRVKLYEFPGFGHTPARYKRKILERFVEDMRGYLREHSFDIILAHSMGGNVVLKAALREGRREKLLLLSPVYGGIGFLRPIACFWPVIAWGIRFLQAPCRGTKFLIRLLSLLTVNRWSAMDCQLVADVRRADAATGARLLAEMAFDQWKIPKEGFKGQAVLILGERDRVISRRHMEMLRKDLGECPAKILKGIGHTAILEDYGSLCWLVHHCINS